MRLIPLLLLPLLLASVVMAETRIVEDANGSVEVPVNPKRIISLHDAFITHPLIELGAPVVGSHGRLGPDGVASMRVVSDFTGKGFEEFGITFLGAFNQLDAEVIASLNPDLIIAPVWQQEAVPGLERIAPVVTVPSTSEDMDSMEVYQIIANAAGRVEQFERMQEDYQDRVRRLQDWVGDPGNIRIAMIQAGNGQITLHGRYVALGQVVNDVGFASPSLLNGQEGGRINLSPELLPELDADFIFDTFGATSGSSPDGPAELMERAVPDWCQRLFACRNRQYVVFERNKVVGESFAAYHYVLDQLITHVAGRAYVLQP